MALKQPVGQVLGQACFDYRFGGDFHRVLDPMKAGGPSADRRFPG
jgi:hypothetical protein